MTQAVFIKECLRFTSTMGHIEPKNPKYLTILTKSKLVQILSNSLGPNTNKD